MMEKLTVLLLIFAVLLRIGVAEVDEPVVTSVSPSTGGIGGGFKLTVFGQNFAKDQYGQNNEVVLKSLDDERTFPCDPFKQDSDTEQLVCYPVSGMVRDTTYYPQVKVGGQKVKDSNLCGGYPYKKECGFTPKWWFTPTIKTLTPYTGPAGDVKLTAYGRSITERYGSNMDISRNGIEKKIIRFYSPGTCELKDGDNLYEPFGLVDEDSYDGYLTCKHTDTFIGCANASYLIEAPYGRSVPDMKLYRIASNGDLCMVQYYAVVDSVEPAMGSTEGEVLAKLAIPFVEQGVEQRGDGSTYAPIRVTIADMDCPVTNVVKNEYLECKVPKKPETMKDTYAGCRGVDVEYWTEQPTNDLDALKAAAPSGDVKHLDITYYCTRELGAAETGAAYTRMTGRFIPPKSGSYRFDVKAGGKAKVFLDNNEQAHSTGSWSYGPRNDLDDQQSYQLLVVGYNPIGDPADENDNPCIEVRANFFSDDRHTSSSTGNAYDEVQKIKVTSERVPEKQRIGFSGFTQNSGSVIHEVQKVSIQGSSFDIKLEMFNTWTEEVSIDDAVEVKAALNKYPWLEEGVDSFDVTQIDETSVRITFNSPRGDIPPFIVHGSEDITTTVREDTKGQSDNDFISLSVGGIPSQPFMASSMDASTLLEAAKSLFEAKCTAPFTTGKKFEDFEGDSNDYVHGELVRNVEPFSGRKSIRNPRKIYPAKTGQGDIRMLGWSDFYACFAYSGLRDPVFKYTYKKKNDEENPITKSIPVHPLQEQSHWRDLTRRFPRTPVSWQIWSYACVHPNYTELQGNSIVELKLQGEDDGEFLVDAVLLTEEQPFKGVNLKLAEQRKRPASPNPEYMVLIDEVVVDPIDGTPDEYDVTLHPFNCGNDFGLIELTNKEESAGTLHVSRELTASEPIEGKIKVAFEGQESAEFNMALEADTIAAILRTSIPKIGTVSVKFSEQSTCSDIEVLVTFESKPGDQELMELVSQEWTSVPTPEAVIEPHVDGHIRFYPILGDMISVERDKPQFRVFINDMLSQCPGDATFEWSEQATPTVESVDPNTGAADDSVVITGTKFSATPEDNEVRIGDILCDVTASTETTITCTVGAGGGSDLQVQVVVAGKGRAAGTATFSYAWEVGTTEPATISCGGGKVMTIHGKGFTKGFMARFGDNECVIKEIQPTRILCIAPKSSSGCDGSTSVTVTVVQPSSPSSRRRRNIGAGTKTSTTQVQYSGSETGLITSFDAPAELSVQGGELITVTGVNLGNSIEEAVTLMFDDGPDMTIDLSSVDVVEGVITATFFMPSGLRPGVVRFGIDMAGTGYAVDQISGELPSRSITLYADSISPQSGSVHGGFLLTLSGKGFGTDMDEVEVEIESHGCQIESLNNEEIVCQVERTAHKETISNLGTTGPFGVYYTSSKPYTEIEVGDCITFTWETPEFVLEVKHGMYETKSLDSTELVPNGISSGAKTLSGAYEVCFNQALNHSMWSGYVDQNEIRNYRTLVVVREKEAWTNAEITVTVNGQQAQYNPPAGAKKRRKREACQHVTTSVRGCSYEEPQTVPDGMYVSFSRCHTPVVDGITFKNAHASLDRSVTTATEITVRGTGFTQDSCAIRAVIGKGDDSCECSLLSPASETQFKCQPASECASTIGVFRELSVWIGNRGYANMDLTMYERSMAFIPLITGIEPDSGSAAGGTPFTITGSGLQFMTSVTVNGYEAECTVISDSSIDCTSPRTSNGDVVVHVRNFESVCETGATCVFRYTNSKTPSVTGIEPNVVDKSADTVLTVTGKRLGENAPEITISFAGEVCRDVTVVDPETEITCTVNGVPAGEHEIDLTVTALGKASSSSTATLTGEPVIEELSPDTGSIHGGTLLTLVGTGFHKDATTVTIDGEICDIEELTVTRIVCVSPDHAAGAVDLQVGLAADEIEFDPQTFTYSTDATPSVTSESVTPTSGVAGESITIPGDKFGDDPSKVTVDIGGADCEVDTCSNSEIVCTLGSHSSEMVTGRVLVEGKGLSNEFTFTYQAELDSVSPSTANYKGGQLLTLNGKGFSEETTATVCDEECIVEDWTVTQIFCVVPPGEDEQACSVTVSEGGLDKTLPDALTYDSAPTAEISSVDPNRGGTGGGNLISITGSGFGNDASAVSVVFAGSECEDVTLVSDTEITCVTSNHTGSVKTHAIVSIGGVRAVETSVGASEFWYIDLWSSTSTWGGNPVPEDGEMIVIKKGTIILLDIDTNVLGGLLIGGELVFDKTQERLELQSHFILVYDGGKLQIGTEDEPYENKAIITLHGHARSPEVPVYGNKVLALMEGRLELHGKHIPTPWTQLTQTAVAGSDQIRIPVGHSINWAEQDEVVIATTGGHLSQHESEMRTITDMEIQGGEAVLTLDSALEYTHSGVTEIHGDRTLEVRAEVGLLTRTVVVRGSNNEEWNVKIEKCADGFNPGEFAVQTCFQGRFGEGLGTDQFGATIMVHQKNQEKDSEIAQAHIEYIEVTHAGQAFRLGRYPIHFHLNGEMPNSYIRGCAVHHTFNRAINIHGVYNTLIEFNVVYNIMGGAIFLEDGIETGNNFQYNLAVFVIASSSLQNDDITPAAFWITNPNNTVRHNHAVGGTHFGFWYRMNERPDGPSYDPNYCPRNIPLGIFYNNTAHSLGWFGVWLFQFYFPMEDGACGTSVERAKPAKFYEVFVYNSDKGFEGVDMGALQLINSIIAQCKSSGYEGVLLVETEERSEKSALVKDTLILGEFDTEELKIDYHGKTNNAIVAPFGRGFRLENVKIKNCDNGIHFAIKGNCKDRCGGFTMQSENVIIEDGTPSLKFRWEHEGVIEDLGDTLCGGTGESRKVIPKREGDSFPPDCVLCAKADNSGVQAYSCPSHYKFHRLAFNDIYPEQLAGKSVRATNEYGSSTADFMMKRLTHAPGWMIILVGGQITTLEFVNAENMVNLTFAGEIYNFVAGDYVVLQVKVLEEPTMFSLDFNGNLLQLSYDESTPMADGPLDIDTVKNGDWYYDADTSLLSFAVVAAADESRRKRDLSASSSKPIKPNAIKCHFPKCITPPPRDEMIPASQRPDDFVYYDQDDLWKVDPDNPEHVIANSSVAEGSVTTNDIHDGFDITILQDEWVVVRFNHLITSSSPRLGKVFLYGGLEISDWPEDSDAVKGATSTEYNLEVEMIFIIGGRLVIGWHDRDFEGQFTLSLTGDPDNEYYVNEDWETGIPVPSNSLAVYGGLDVFGKNYSLVWTTLTATVNAGEDTVYVANDVSAWPVGGEVLVTTTGYRPDESEKLTIAAVTANSITFTGGVNYRHIGSFLEVDGTTYGFSAAVALLSRNVKFTSRPWTNGGADAGTVRVSVMLDENGDINTGYARVHYAEFVGLGSDGFSTKSDPRFGLSYVNTGNKRDSKPSSLYHNSFHDLYNAGFGAFGTSGYEMFDNVVYKSVGQSVVIDSTNTAVQYNLGSNMQWTGAYNGRSEENNLRYEAIFDISEATNTLFEGNYAVGSERSGFRLPGDACDEASRHVYSEATANIAAVNQMGITFFFDYEINQPDDCVMISGFKLWKNVDYGILYIKDYSPIFSDIVFADNQVDLFAMVYGDDPLSHQCTPKTVKVEKSVSIGRTPSMDCTEARPSGTAFELSDNCRGRTAGDGGKLGLLFGMFPGGHNKAPQKPCANVITPNAPCGHMTVSDTIFSHYGSHSGTSCPPSYAIATNPNDDDHQGPMFVTTTKTDNVEAGYEFWINRPNIGKIKISDCVDMDCDAFKKVLFQDSDGDFLGSPGSVISQSEWEWGGDPRRGLGDYRIPTVMQTRLDGSRIPFDEIYDETGIARPDGCTLEGHKYNPSDPNSKDFAYYKCLNVFYHQLAIESMDEDKMSRRLSPVAVRARNANGKKFIDLINGPQDHGCCSGYLCLKRLSTFMAILPDGTRADIYLTSTTPDRLKFSFVAPAPTACNLLVVYYSKPNRIDLYVDGVFKLPTNGGYDKFGKYKLVNEKPKEEYIPSCATSENGDNYIDRENKEVYLVLKGSSKAVLHRSVQIMVSIFLPAMTPEEFFGEKLIENLAAILNIPQDRVRIVDVVSANEGRRKRATGTEVTAEIGPEPTQAADDANTEEDVTPVLDSVVTICQSDKIGEAVMSEGASCGPVETPQGTYTNIVPATLQFYQQIVPQHEKAVFATQPKLRAHDSEGNVITQLGIESNPWQMEAKIRSGTGHPQAVLGGTTTVVSDNGWFNFTGMFISHAATGYYIDFDIIMPSTAVDLNLKVSYGPFEVAAVPMKARLFAMTSGDIIQNSPISLSLELHDETTGQTIQDITWREHSFSAYCGLPSYNEISNISGTQTQPFAASTGRVEFDDLILTGYGPIFLECLVESTPAEFSIPFYQKVFVLSSNTQGGSREKTDEISIRFLDDFATTVPTDAKKAELEQRVLQKITTDFPNIVIVGSTIEEGSIVITFTVEGSTDSVTLMQQDLCAAISEGQSYTLGSTTLTLDGYMTVDGQPYYGVSCAAEAKGEGLHPGFIALIAVLGVLLIVIVVLLLLWKFKVMPKTKTHDNGKTVYLRGGILHEGTFNSLKSEAVAPSTTLYSSHGGADLRSSPAPMFPPLHSEATILTLSAIESNTAGTSTPAPVIQVEHPKPKKIKNDGKLWKY